MGIEYSTEAHQHIPVTGAPNSLEVIKGSGKHVKKDVVILRLRENGLNYSIVDLDGEPYFSVQSTELMDNSIKLLDTKGKTVASCRKERFGPGNIVNIIVKNGWSKKNEAGRALTAATLYHGEKQSGHSCQIFLHNPPIPAEEFKLGSKLPDLTVEGDVMLKEFDFIVDTKVDKPVKIARAVHDIAELKDPKISNKVDPDSNNQNNYWLQVGRNIDLAFIVLASHGMDLMFYDESYD